MKTKIYTITRGMTNINEIETYVFINYNKAIIKWNELYKDSIEDAEILDEYTKPKEHKHLSVDDGDYYIVLDLDTHEVENE